VDRLAIDAVKMAIAEIVGGLIVIEVIVLPAAALIALAPIAPAIIDAAIEPNGGAPIAWDEAIAVVEVAPVTGSPIDTLSRRFDPGSWRPVVVLIGIVPGPISGGPDIALGGGRRLIIGGKRRRRRGRELAHRLGVAGVAPIAVRISAAARRRGRLLPAAAGLGSHDTIGAARITGRRAAYAIFLAGRSAKKKDASENAKGRGAEKLGACHI
jgi:hypothetical protein